MNNFSIIAIYMPLVVGTILILVSITGRDMSKRTLRDYLYFCLSLLGWQITESLYFVFEDPDMIKVDYNIKLIFVGLCAVFIVRVIIGFYKLNKKTPVWAGYIILIVPFITAVMVVTGLDDTYIRTGFEVVSTYPITGANYEYGIWYEINTIFANLMILCVGIVVLMMHYRLPKAYRNPSLSFMIAIFLYVAGYAIDIIWSPTFDAIMMGCSLSNLAVYFVVAKSETGEYLTIAQREIFNYLDEAIFILDEKKRIVDANKTAVEWLQILGKRLIFVSFPKMLELFEKNDLLELGPSENDNCKEIRITHTDIPLVFEMCEIEMLNESGEVKGEFVTIEDVTRNSLFIDRLEIDAGMDPLTGLQNRYTYEELIVDLDKKDNLPISVIVGDVNSLKYINDTYGHMAGDSLLSSVGDVIRQSCPKNGYAARVGGDEFVIIVPVCNEASCKKIISEIKMQIAEINNLPFEVGMALGSVTKSIEEGSLRTLVDKADKEMYYNKSREKGGNK